MDFVQHPVGCYDLSCIVNLTFTFVKAKPYALKSANKIQLRACVHCNAFDVSEKEAVEVYGSK